jgi:hypothetical protein
MSQRVFRGLLAAIVLAIASQAARAEDGGNAVLDKAIKAVGGEETLSKVKAVSWKTKGTLTFMGADNAISTATIAQGLTHSKQEFEGDFGGNKIKGSSVLAGDKGWRSFAGMTMELDPEALAEAKRVLYLQMGPTLLVPLKGKEFKIVAADDDKVDGKTAKGLKITGPDSKTFTLYFDETSGLPVKMVAKVKDFSGDEFTQTTSYTDYKEFQGIKKATKVEAKRDGEKFQVSEITEFKILDSVDPKTFAEPKD